MKQNYTKETVSQKKFSEPVLMFSVIIRKKSYQT